MAAKISNKGSVELPAAMRRKVGLRPGDPVEFKLNSEGIVVAPRKKHKAPKSKAKIIKDPVTGLPVLDTVSGAPPLTSEMVAALQSGSNGENARSKKARRRMRKPPTSNPKIITDPITGYPVLTAGPGAPMLTNEEVAEILADFP
jgi:AbrB family looped-hinge helix DNA binding protein